MKLMEYSAFYKRDSSADGFRNECKECCIVRTKATYREDQERNKEWHREHHRKKLELNPNWHVEHYAANKERMSVYNAMYYRKHYRVKRLAQSKQWAQDNPGMANANKKAYKAAKINACPPWVQDDDNLTWMMAQVYELAALRSEMFGFSWHVDHIVPLRGERVSGLHVPWNLQVIPGVDNMSKSNKFV
jgi:hypothetical protein